MKNPFKMFARYLRQIGGVDNPDWQQPLEDKSDVELCQLLGTAEHNRWFHSKNAVIAAMFAIVLLALPAMGMRQELSGSDALIVIGATTMSVLSGVTALMIMVEVVAFNAAKVTQIERILQERNI